MSQEEQLNQAQARPAELSAAALKEEYSAMRKRLAQAELQIDKMRFGGVTAASEQPQESVHQEALSLRKKLEEQYDLDASGTYTSLQKREQKREEVGANLRRQCSTPAQSGEDPRQPPLRNEDRAPSRGISAGNETTSEASDSRGVSSEGGGTAGQVDNSVTNDDALSCGSSGSLTPDIELAEPQILTSATFDSHSPESPSPEGGPMQPRYIVNQHLQPSLEAKAPLSEPQAVTVTTATLSATPPPRNNGRLGGLVRPLPPSLQRKVSAESRQVAYLLAVRRLEEEIADLKEGLGTGGLPLDSVVDTLGKVCSEHSRLAAEVTSLSSVGACCYTANSREHMMEELSQLAWHICELEAQLKKRTTRQALAQGSETSNNTKASLSSSVQGDNGRQSEPNISVNDSSHDLQDDFSHTTENPSYTKDDHSHTTEDPSLTTEDPSHTTEDPSHTTGDHSHTTENPSYTKDDHSHTTEDPSHTTGDPSHTTEDPSHTTGDHSHTSMAKEAGMASMTVQSQRGQDNGPWAAVISGPPGQTPHSTGQPSSHSHTHIHGDRVGSGKSRRKPVHPPKGQHQKGDTLVVNKKVQGQTNSNWRAPDGAQTVLSMVEEEAMGVEPAEQSLATSLAAIDALKSDLATLRQDIASSIADSDPSSPSSSVSNSTKPGPPPHFTSFPRHTRSHSASYVRKVPTRPTSVPHHNHRRASSAHPTGNDPRSLGSVGSDLRRRASLHTPTLSALPLPDLEFGLSSPVSRHLRSQSWSSAWLSEVPAHLDSHSGHPGGHSGHPGGHSEHSDTYSVDSVPVNLHRHGALLSGGVEAGDNAHCLNDLEAGNESRQHVGAGVRANVGAGVRTIYNLPASNQGNKVFPYDPLVQAPDGDLVNSDTLATPLISSGPVSSNSTRQMDLRVEQSARKLTNAMREQGVCGAGGRLEIGRPLQSIASEDGGETGSDWLRARDISSDPDQMSLMSSYPGYRPVRHDFSAISEPQAFSTPLQTHQGGYPGHQGSGMQPYQSSKPGSHRMVVKKQPYMSNAWNGDSDIWTGDRHAFTGVSGNDVTSVPSIKSDVLRTKDGYLPEKTRHTHYRRHSHDGHMSGQHMGVAPNKMYSLHDHHSTYHLELDLSNACQLAQKLDERCQRMKRTLDKELSTHR